MIVTVLRLEWGYEVQHKRKKLLRRELIYLPTKYYTILHRFKEWYSFANYLKPVMMVEHFLYSPISIMKVIFLWRSLLHYYFYIWIDCISDSPFLLRLKSSLQKNIRCIRFYYLYCRMKNALKIRHLKSKRNLPDIDDSYPRFY
jgi:hypothetical protein